MLALLVLHQPHRLFVRHWLQQNSVQRGQTHILHQHQLLHRSNHLEFQSLLDVRQ